MPTQKKTLTESGKRKTSIARAVIKPGKGRVYVNSIPLELYQPDSARVKMQEPLLLAGSDAWKDADIKVKVNGGGFMGQAEATRIAIARALVSWTRSPKVKKTFIEHDRTVLAGDPRRKEAKKFGGPGARVRKQKSYR